MYFTIVPQSTATCDMGREKKREIPNSPFHRFLTEIYALRDDVFVKSRFDA